MRKIKIYIFHPYSKIGGADLTISRLINNLDKKRYEIVFICLNQPAIKVYLKRKIKIISIKRFRAYQCIPVLKKIININEKNDKKFKKVIFISNQNFANIISIIALKKFNHIKKILIERNNPIELDYIKSFKNTIIKKLIPITYKLADKVIGISKELSKDLQKLSKVKVDTIYNPAFEKKNIKKKQTTKSIKKLKNILCIARFEKQKNHLMLLKAFKLSLKKINAKLTLIGYGSLKKKIIKYVYNNNLKENVEIVSNSKNIQNYYDNADLFCLTSIYEGFGNVLVEAAINKIPIISTKCKSGPCEILGNGIYGDLVKIGDTKKLSKLIIKNLNKPDKSKILKMYKSLDRFNIKKHINKYEEIFRKI